MICATIDSEGCRVHQPIYTGLMYVEMVSIADRKHMHTCYQVRVLVDAIKCVHPDCERPIDNRHALYYYGLHAETAHRKEHMHTRTDVRSTARCQRGHRNTPPPIRRRRPTRRAPDKTLQRESCDISRTERTLGTADKTNKNTHVH